jgi:serine acetyltransferase
VSFHLPVRISGNGKLRFGSGCRVEKDVSFNVSPRSLLDFQSNTTVGDGSRITILPGARAVFAEGANIYHDCELTIENEWTIGLGSILASHCSISARENGFPSSFSVGQHSCIGDWTLIDTTGGVTIGNNVAIGPHCIFYSHDHEPAVDGVAAWKGIIKTGAIKIGDGAWIGARVTILPSVTIGERAVVGAGAVVTRDIPAYCLAVGVPAKVVKKTAESDKERI